MAGVARVFVKVVPDTDGFKETVQTFLQRLEKSVSAAIQVAADLDPARRNVEAFAAEIARDGATLRVDADTRDASKRIDDASKSRTATVNADADTGKASAKLDLLTRPRSILVSLNVNTTKAKAQIAKALGTFTGITSLRNLTTSFSESITGLLDNLPRVALMATTVAGLGAAGLNAVHGIGAVVVQLADLVPLAATLPAALAAGAVGVTTLVLAFKKMPASVKNAAEAYKSLEGIVSKDFWTPAAKPIRALLTGLLPQMKSGFKDVATALGASLGDIASELKTAFGGSALSSVFTQMAAGIKAATPGLKAFAGVFVSLLGVGAQYLPQFGAWVSKIGTQFSGWLSGVEASGELDQMIQGAITTLGQLGSVLVSVGRILSGVFKAGSGDSAIGALASGLATVADIVNGPAFQATLSLIFAGAAAGAAGLAKALAPIGDMLTALAPVLSGILSSAGATLGNLLSNVAAALSTPAFQAGLTDFFAGIESGLNAVAPALPSLAALLGELGIFAGQLASQIGPVLATALTEAAPQFVQLLQTVTPLLPQLEQLAVQLIPVLVFALESLNATLQVLVPILNWVISGLTGGFNAVNDLFGLLNGDRSLAQFVQDAANIPGPVGDMVKAVLGFTDSIKSFFAGLTSSVSSAVAAVKTAVAGIAAFIGGAFDGVSGAVKGTLNGIIDGINNVIKGINGSDIAKAFGGVLGIKFPLGLIPHLASGADILPSAGGTLALLGEAGQAETVTNRGKTNRLITAATTLAQQALSNGLGFPSQVTLVDANGSLLGQMDVRISNYDQQQARAQRQGWRS